MRLLVRFGNGFLRGRFADTAIRPPPCHQSAPIAGRGCHAAEWNPRGVTLVETGPISASDGFCGVAPTHRSKCGWTKCGIRLSKKRAFECTLETQPPNGPFQGPFPRALSKGPYGPYGHLVTAPRFVRIKTRVGRRGIWSQSGPRSVWRRDSAVPIQLVSGRGPLNVDRGPRGKHGQRQTGEYGCAPRVERLSPE